MPSPPLLSIIIVSWNVRDLLRDCLRSVYGQSLAAELEVIVVDGASRDGTVAMVTAEFPQVTLIPCPTNVGFPRGNNLGLAQARGEYLYLLNPDTKLVGDGLAAMVAYLAATPPVGLVGAQLLNEDGTVQSSRRRFPTLATGFWESTWLQPYAPTAVLQQYYATDLPDDEIAAVDWVMGASLLIRRAVYEQVGGMDEGYFMYSEELDWAKRIKKAGWTVIYFPAAQVLHYGGKSSEQVSAQRHIHFNRAKLRYYQKFHGRGAATFLRLFLLGSYAWQLLLEGVKAAVGHKRPLRLARIAAYWQLLRTGLPPAVGQGE